MSIFVEPVPATSLPGWRLIADRCRNGRSAGRSVMIGGPDLGAQAFLDEDSGQRTSETVTAGDRVTFVQRWPGSARMIIVGADGLAGALSEQARLLGYAVTVCDPRPVFATPQRFPGSTVVRAWPDSYLREEASAGRCDDRTVVCVLTHDVRVDVAVIMVALGLPDLAFVGATGSRATCADREQRLLQAGCPSEDLVRLRTPLGLDLGGRDPAEAAVSIVAEILAERHARRGGRLRDGRGPLHEPVRDQGTAAGLSPRPTG